MRVKIEELKEGCILSTDVFSRTNRPVLAKKTILTEQLIEILKIYLIKDVVVERILATGKPFIPAGIVEDEEGQHSPNILSEENGPSLNQLYLNAVQEYKKEYISWQSGMPIKIARVREILLPLLDAAEKSIADIFNLHHFSMKNEYLYQHSIAVGILSGFIAKRMNYDKGDIIQVALAGFLADCGMAKLSTKIINKQTSLTVEEFEDIKEHPNLSYKMVQNVPLLREATKLAIVQHHERLDGSGYPFGEKEDKIHPFAKIIGLADTFHAMTSERFYKRKLSPFKVLEMISEDQFGKFDLKVLKALSSGFMNFSTGSKIKLSNGQQAEILFIEETAPTRPLIRILETDEIIHLSKHRQVFIEEIVTSAE
ncbi:phosphohydrolase [Bacillus canaveralius]|uniref:Phosphohydrolase n=1 Tax=Bacillus canaveralius TaxID=1403243 RepID=A0A2N5GMX4_9BACI|nr:MULTISPECIES: HD-GYP domain-containing protein [Bacillus]PLR80647.1 phosphohydrolase [Bacillus sp. V33-4]PLR83359.1 phosphohydrolase [Bacillus canaveralius]PLR94191.1 phosphohydrolase [Bacillus canaveralius]RSK52119.1 HD-GYP domain-containing protein [Bacillus canaveralius]